MSPLAFCSCDGNATCATQPSQRGVGDAGECCLGVRFVGPQRFESLNVRFIFVVLVLGVVYLAYYAALPVGRSTRLSFRLTSLLSLHLLFSLVFHISRFISAVLCCSCVGCVVCFCLLHDSHDDTKILVHRKAVGVSWWLGFVLKCGEVDVCLRLMNTSPVAMIK
jgi:hypothetical protein